MEKVLITGGHGDIAQAIIRLLHVSGEYEIKAPGKEEMDVTDIKAVKSYTKQFTPDILINNAGYVAPQSIKMGVIEREKKSIEINLFGIFNCAAAVLELNPAAVIINIGSSAATKVHGTWSSYCATKAGVVMATQCWAKDGVNAVCISPGRTATKMRRALFPDEDRTGLLQPDDFAKIVLKAIRREYINGTHINVTKDNVLELLK